MKRTARLIVSISAIVLTLVVMSVGVYAATNISLTPTGNNITFTATDVAATITGTKQMGSGTATNLTIPNNGVFGAAHEQGNEYAGTIELGGIEFTDVAATYTLTLNVTNDFTTTAIGVTYSADTTDTNGYVVIASTTAMDGGGAQPYSNGTQITLAAGSTVTIKTTINITDTEGTLDTILENGFDNVLFNFTLDVARVS